MESDNIPSQMDRKVQLQQLLSWVAGRTGGIDRLSVILSSVSWGPDLGNAIKVTLINSKGLEISRAEFEKLLGKVPRNKLVGLLIEKVDVKHEIAGFTLKFIFKSVDGSVLEAAARDGCLPMVKEILTDDNISEMCQFVLDYPTEVTSEILDICWQHPSLAEFCIPRYNYSHIPSLLMHGVICFNDFRGHELSERAEAKLEAETIKESLQYAGLSMHSDIKNWTTYKLFQGLREFCNNVRQSASLVVVCLMSHGEAGSLYGWNGETTGLTDSCHINDVIYILTEGLPTYIPKVSKDITANENCEATIIQGVLDARVGENDSPSQVIIVMT